VSSAVAQLPVLDLDLRITVGESALRGNRFVGYNLYNRGESVALDRSALVEAGGGGEPPRDAAATAIGRGKLPDIPGERSLPGSLPQGRDDPIRKALFPEFGHDRFELTKL
jgi:hypothetical protein